MSSRTELKLHPSVAAGLIAAIPWLALVVFVLVAATAGKWPLLLALLPAIAAALVQFRRVGLLSGGKAITALRFANGPLEVQLGQSEPRAMAVAGCSQLSARLALLKLTPFDTKFRAYYAVLLADVGALRGNVPPEDFRRLRVWLRLGRPQQRHPLTPELE